MKMYENESFEFAALRILFWSMFGYSGDDSETNKSCIEHRQTAEVLAHDYWLIGSL